VVLDGTDLVGSMTAYTISATGDGPSPRLGHASILVGNAFIGTFPLSLVINT